METCFTSPVNEPPDVARGWRSVVVLILLYVLAVCVVALEETEADEFGEVISSHVLQVWAHRIVVDE